MEFIVATQACKIQGTACCYLENDNYFETHAIRVIFVKYVEQDEQDVVDIFEVILNIFFLNLALSLFWVA